MRLSVWSLCLTLIIAWLVLDRGWEPSTAMWAVCGVSALVSVVGIVIVMAISDEPREIWAAYSGGCDRIALLIAKILRWWLGR